MEAKVEQPQEIEISAVLHRADGTTVDLGIIDAHYKNPFKRFAWTWWGRPSADHRIRQANKDA